MTSALAVSMLFCAVVTSVDTKVNVRETVMLARGHQDNWRCDERCTLSVVGSNICVMALKPSFTLRYAGIMPGPPLFAGADEYILRTSGSVNGDVILALRQVKCKKKDQVVRMTAPWTDRTVFKARHSPEDTYVLESIVFSCSDTNARPSFVLGGLDSVALRPAVAALKTDIETGNPFHLVRQSIGEKSSLVFRNASDCQLECQAKVLIEDYFGDKDTRMHDLRLKPGEISRCKVNERLPKGIRYVTIIVESGGDTATNHLTYASIDLHEVTPQQPKGEFRFGVNFHGSRYAPVWRQIGMDAAVAIGAKIVRDDLLHFSSNWLGENKFNWKDDEEIDGLLSRGLAIDAIVWWPADWALIRDADGGLEKSGRRAFRPGMLRRYGEMLGERYGDRIAYYEVGNEWDMSSPKWLPYDDAVRQVREFAEGMHSKCPSARVIPGGFAAESSVRHPSMTIRPMFQENLMRDLQKDVDAHPVHLHSPYKEYASKVRFFLQWRKEQGITIPWYANETSISTTTMRPDDRAAAAIAWQKTLFGWSRGSLDHIWYNLRATSYNPDDHGCGYGMFTAEFYPRATAAAYAALASTFRHMAADGVLHDGKERQVLRFAGRRDGHDVRVVTGWDMFAERPLEVRIRTDAARAEQVDTMGNRTAIAIRNGVVVWHISSHPSALYLEDSTKAEPFKVDLDNEARRPLKIIQPKAVLGDKDSADLVLKEYEQVYEAYKAMPEHVGRTWRWWGDLWVWVNTAWRDGKLHINLRCWDDVFHPRPDDPLNGDCAMVRLGGWKLLLVGGDKPRVDVLEAPTGKTTDVKDQMSATCKPGYHTEYLLTVSPNALGLGNEIPFNVRVYDDDGLGFDKWIEYTPFDEEPQALIRLQEF